MAGIPAHQFQHQGIPGRRINTESAAQGRRGVRLHPDRCARTLSPCRLSNTASSNDSMLSHRSAEQETPGGFRRSQPIPMPPNCRCAAATHPDPWLTANALMTLIRKLDSGTAGEIMRISTVGFSVAFVFLVAVNAPIPSALGQDATPQASVADLQVVDCLLPGQVRRLGQSRYSTAR